MKDTFPNVRYTLPDAEGQDARQPRLHRLVLDGEGLEEQGGRLDAADAISTGKQGMKKWTSKGLALPARSDVKPVAGRGAFLTRYPRFTHGWGNPGRLRARLDTTSRTTS